MAELGSVGADAIVLGAQHSRKRVHTEVGAQFSTEGGLVTGERESPSIEASGQWQVRVCAPRSMPMSTIDFSPHSSKRSARRTRPSFSRLLARCSQRSCVVCNFPAQFGAGATRADGADGSNGEDEEVGNEEAGTNEGGNSPRHRLRDSPATKHVAVFLPSQSSA